MRRVRADESRGPEKSEEDNSGQLLENRESTSGPARTEDPSNGLPVVYTSVYTEAASKPRKKWGALLMSISEAADYLGVRGEEVAKLHADGELAGAKVGSEIRFRRGDLAAVTRRLFLAAVLKSR